MPDSYATGYPPPPPQNYPPHPQYPQLPVREKGFWEKIGVWPVIAGTCFLFALVAMRPVTNNPSATQAPSNAVAPAPVPGIPVAPSVSNGPTFQEADSKMDSRISTWTQAQKDAYWATIVGTRVQWSGELLEVRSDRTGSLYVKCNPNSFVGDVNVDLDGTQLNMLASLNKGQRVRFSGLLRGHGVFGYTISNGHVD